MKMISGILTVLFLCACHPSEERALTKVEADVDTNDTEKVIQSIEALTAKIQAAHAERNQRIRDFAYVSAVAGYAAATNGVPFERISNHVEKIAVEFFQAKP